MNDLQDYVCSLTMVDALATWAMQNGDGQIYELLGTCTLYMLMNNFLVAPMVYWCIIWMAKAILRHCSFRYVVYVYNDIETAFERNENAPDHHDLSCTHVFQEYYSAAPTFSFQHAVILYVELWKYPLRIYFIFPSVCL